MHYIGNKNIDEINKFSSNSLQIDDDLKNILTSYFTTSFKTSDYSNFFHDSGIKYNVVFGLVSEIFENPNTLFTHSINLAKHLYDQSGHPKIKGGEFYTVHFRDCILDHEKVEAIGLFKTENKDTYLKILHENGNFNVNSEKGINIKKIDKGCLIFNKDKDNGYIVLVVDNTNKGVEARYWIDDFLHVTQRKDEYYNTKHIIKLAKNFVTKELPQNFEVSKADQITILNKATQFLKEKDIFNMEQFMHEVISQPKVIESFNHYTRIYQEERDLEIANTFSISDSAVRKQQHTLKNVIRLDKKIQIIIDGNQESIEQGQDAKGKFYKVYYQEEE